MNAPLDPPYKSTDALVAEHLAHEDRIRAGFKADTSPLAIFQQSLSRKRRARSLASVVRFGRLKRLSRHAQLAPDTLGAVFQTVEPRRSRRARSRERARRLPVGSLARGARTVGLAILLGLAGTGTLVALNWMYPHEVNDVLSDLASGVHRFDEQIAELDRRVKCAVETPVVDRSGALITTRSAAPDACAAGRPHYLTTPVTEEVALRLMDAVTAIEGHSLSKGGRSFLGVFDIAAFKRAVEAMRADNELTGSPPLLSAIESARGQPGHIGVRDKLGSMAVAAVYSATRLRTDAERARFIAMHMPCVSHFGRARAGGLCSWYLFGKSPEESLATGEICLMAGAMGYQIVPEGVAVNSRENHLDRLKRVKIRAANCARRIGETDAEIDMALELIDRFTPWQSIEEMRAIGREVYRNAALLDGLPKRGGTTDPLVLSLDRRVVTRLPALLTEVLPTLDPALASDLCFRESVHCEAPDSVFALAEVTEPGAVMQLRVAWSNRHLRLFPTGAEPRPAPPAGSWSKLPLTLLLDPGDALCNRAFGRITNPGGGDGVRTCADGQGWVDAAGVFTQSLNLPLIDLVAGMGPIAPELYRALGYHLVPGDMAAQKIGMVLGTEATAPVGVHMAVLAALQAGAEGRSARASGPSLVAGHAVAPVDLEQTLSDLGLPVARAATAGRLLEGVGQPGGTAPPLAADLSHLGCGRVLAKTGSAESGDHASGTRARGLLAAFQCGDRRFVSAVLIASRGDADTDIGHVPVERLVDLTTLMTRLVITGG